MDHLTIETGPALRGDDATAAAVLRRAHDLYVEIGAGGHAERLTEELGARR